MTCSRAESGQAGAERTAGAASPAGSERWAPGALPCAWAAALFPGGRPRFQLWGSAAGRTMLLKEYRICMPLTVDEVNAAPGPASPAPGPPPLAPRPLPWGAASPAAASWPASPLRAAGEPGGTLSPPKPGGWSGWRKGNCRFHLSPQPGKRRWVGRWTPGGPLGIQKPDYRESECAKGSRCAPFLQLRNE